MALKHNRAADVGGSGSSTITALASFTPASGASDPYGRIARDGAGNIFGTTLGGGRGGGTVFELPAGSNSISTLLSFDGTTLSAFLVAATDGVNVTAAQTVKVTVA